MGDTLIFPIESMQASLVCGDVWDGEGKGTFPFGRDVEEFDGFRRRSPDRDVLPFRIRGEVVQGRRLLVLAALAP